MKERYINFSDDDARKLFGIPSEIPDPNPPATPTEQSNTEDLEDENSCADNENAPSASHSPVPANLECKVESTEAETGEHDENQEGSDAENDETNSQCREKKSVIRMIEIPVPEVIIGDTLILLLECTRVKPKVKVLSQENESSNDSTDVEQQVEEEEDENADFFISQRIGPQEFEKAIETQPES